MFKVIKRQKWIWLDRIQLRKKINLYHGPLKVIIGAGNSQYDGWIKSDYPVFNAINYWEWKFIFKKKQISNLLAEHVLEHLTVGQVEILLKNSLKKIAKSGVFRIAVPDQFHVNKEYIEYVKPNGAGLGSDDHKSFWNYKSFSELAKGVGFSIDLIEYWDEEGNFHSSNFNIDNGIIIRSKSKGFKCDIKDYSSLIIDLKKH